MHMGRLESLKTRQRTLISNLPHFHFTLWLFQIALCNNKERTFLINRIIIVKGKSIGRRQLVSYLPKQLNVSRLNTNQVGGEGD